jgi:HD-like signal output (HDOD) protein/GGDEF domain-containing protein
VDVFAVTTDSALTLDRLLARARQLYTLPTVAMKVLELTSNPEVDTHALKECIENDPALTGKVLRVVNSSLFGLAREVSDLNQALALLGSKPLKLLVLGFSLPSGLFGGVAAPTLGRYWRHALTKAVAAREISQRAWGQLGDEAFIAGLLQDLGVLVLIQELGAPYVQFVEKVVAQGADLQGAETEALGFDHTTLTARLLDSWGLPDALVDAVQWKADRSAATSPPAHRRLAQIVDLAELVARLVADRHADVLGPLLAAAGRDHGLSDEQVRALLAVLEEKVGQLADVLSLRLPPGWDCHEVVDRAYAQLAEVAAATAAELASGAHPRSRAVCDVAALAEEARTLSAALTRFFRRSAESIAPPRRQRSSRAAALQESAEAVGVEAAGAPHATACEADPALPAQLTASVAACRQARRPLSLVLFELGPTESLLSTFGFEGFQDLRRMAEEACWALDHPRAVCLPYGEAGFALVLPNCDRQLAVRLGNELIDRVRRAMSGRGSSPLPTPGLSVGAATASLPPKNFPAHDLLSRADRCLYGSRSSGGGVVKSIEIY